MTGFNTEVRHRGAVFHVQTQDAGPGGRCVESLIYKSGKVVSSRKSDYTPFLGSPDLRDKVARLMSDQHAAIIRDIRDGKFDHYLSPDEKEPGPQKS
jgi:hypothetical protein